MNTYAGRNIVVNASQKLIKIPEDEENPEGNFEEALENLKNATFSKVIRRTAQFRQEGSSQSYHIGSLMDESQSASSNSSNDSSNSETEFHSDLEVYNEHHYQAHSENDLPATDSEQPSESSLILQKHSNSYILKQYDQIINQKSPLGDSVTNDQLYLGFDILTIKQVNQQRSRSPLHTLLNNKQLRKQSTLDSIQDPNLTANHLNTTANNINQNQANANVAVAAAAVHLPLHQNTFTK